MRIDHWKHDAELESALITATRAHLTPYPASLTAYNASLSQMQKDYPRADQATHRLRHVMHILADAVLYGNYPK